MIHRLNVSLSLSPQRAALKVLAQTAAVVTMLFQLSGCTQAKEKPSQTQSTAANAKTAIASHSSTLDFPLADVYTRDGISLDGEWKTFVDPYLAGYQNFHNVVYENEAVISKSGFFTDSKVDNPQELLEYNFDEAQSLVVPGDWNTQREKLYYYEGSVWYRTKFDSPVTKGNDGEQVILHFGAANYHASIYLNGEKLGEHTGGFTPFQFEISKQLKSRDNSLVVKVDNTRYQSAVPTPNTDWWNYGGLTRSVSLYVLPASYIHDYEWQILDLDSRTVQVRARVANSATSQTVVLSMPELGIEQRGTVDNEGFVAFDFLAPNSELWTPDKAKLYTLRLSTADDQFTDRIGFRTIATRGKELLLNGDPIFLRGISIHEEYAAEGGGRTATKANAKQLLNWAKDLNANFVRLAHYPHNEHMARLADEMGILVWAEVPVYWSIDWANTATYQNAQNQLVELIDRDYNRSSVIIWSVANETPLGDTRVRFLRGLVDTTRTLDTSRLVSAALLHRKKEDPFQEFVDDPMGEYLDIVSFNQYVGWYDKLPDAIPKVSWSVAYNKPVFISEFGAGAKYGYRGDRSVRWTEEYQAWLYANTVEMLEGIDGYIGLSPWILADFRSPKRVLPKIQDDFNRKGLLSEKGERKLAFEVLKQYYDKKQKEGADSFK